MSSILFLTATDPTKVPYWNSELPGALSAAGFDTTVASWTSPVSELIDLATQHTHICLLTAARYNLDIQAFDHLLTEILPAVRGRRPSIKILNSIELTLWNYAKTYLADLQATGFPVPRTQVCTLDSFRADSYGALSQFTNGAAETVVVKPIVGADGLDVFKIKNACAPTADEIVLIQDLLSRTSESLLVQEYLPEIKTNGELSLVYIAGTLIVAFLKAVDGARHDEFRVNGDHGGTITILSKDQVPATAIDVAQRLYRHLAHQFGPGACAYMRVDGILRQSDGSFTIMEVECIEPAMLLDNPVILSKVVNAFSDLVRQP